MFDYSALVAGQTVTFSNTITNNSAVFSNTTSFAGTASFNGPVSISGTFTITGYSTFDGVTANNIIANTISVKNITVNSSNGSPSQFLMSNGSDANNTWVDVPFVVHPFILIGM